MKTPLVAEISYDLAPLFPYLTENKEIREMWVWITARLLRERSKIRVSSSKFQVQLIKAINTYRNNQKH